MISESIGLEAPFFDVDSCHVVWHGNYVKYFEEARCKLLDTIGYNYKDMAAAGYLFPVVDLRVKYVKPVVFTQKIFITATIKEWEHRLKITYRITDQNDGSVLTKGETTQVAVEASTGIMQFDTPQAFQDKVNKLLNTGSV